MLPEEKENEQGCAASTRMGETRLALWLNQNQLGVWMSWEEKLEEGGIPDTAQPQFPAFLSSGHVSWDSWELWFPMLI